MIFSRLYKTARKGGKFPGKLDLHDVCHLADEVLEAGVRRGLQVARETVASEKPENIPNWALFAMLIGNGLTALESKLPEEDTDS